LRAETGVLWSRPVLRGVRGDSTVLRLRHIWLHNSFQTLAVLRLTPGGHGTAVQVTLRSRYYAAGLVTLWLGIAILISVVTVVAFVAGTASLADLWFALLFPMFGFVVLVFGRLLARSERTALLDFIRQTTGAQDLAPALRPSS
jgi:hypothetical protein